MTEMDTVSAPQSSKGAGPEEFDLVILGGGTGATIAGWTFFI